MKESRGKRDSIEEINEVEQLKRKLNMISLAKSMVEPRPDFGEKSIRVQPDLAQSLKSPKVWKILTEESISEDELIEDIVKETEFNRIK